MTTAPEDYVWSRYRKNALGADDYLVRPHPVYPALCADTAERCGRYRAFVSEATTTSETDDIRLHLHSQYAFGSRRFREIIEAQLGRCAGPEKIGGPRKARDSATGSAL